MAISVYVRAKFLLGLLINVCIFFFKSVLKMNKLKANLKLMLSSNALFKFAKLSYSTDKNGKKQVFLWTGNLKCVMHFEISVKVFSINKNVNIPEQVKKKEYLL